MVIQKQTLWRTTKRFQAFKFACFLRSLRTVNDGGFVRSFQDNTLFAGCGDNNIYMWDLETRMLQVRFFEILFSFFTRTYRSTRLRQPVSIT